MKNTIIKFGIYGLLTASILFLLSFLLGKNLDFDLQAVVGYTSMVISLLFIYFVSRIIEIMKITIMLH